MRRANNSTSPPQPFSIEGANEAAGSDLLASKEEDRRLDGTRAIPPDGVRDGAEVSPNRGDRTCSRRKPLIHSPYAESCRPLPISIDIQIQELHRPFSVHRANFLTSSSAHFTAAFHLRTGRAGGAGAPSPPSFMGQSGREREVKKMVVSTVVSAVYTTVLF